MIVMRKRSTEILQRLIADEKMTFTLSSLAAEYNVTERTLRNDIKEINEFLRVQAVERLTFDVEGHIERPHNFNALELEQAIYNMGAYDYKFSGDERQIYIITTLLMNDGITTMQTLAENLSISRATILNDFEGLRARLKKYDLELFSDAGKGITVRCAPGEKVKILVDVFRRVTLNTAQDGFFQNFILRKMHIRYQFGKIFSKLQEYTKVNNLIFVDTVFYDIVLYIFVLFNMEKTYRAHAELEDISVYVDSMEQMLIYTACVMNVRLSGEMLNDYRGYLKEHRLSLYVKNVDDINLYKAIIRFLKRIDERLSLNLADDNVLINSLLIHIKSMKDWHSARIEIPKEHDMLFNYELLCQLVEDNANILESFLHYRLKDEMKKSIVIHICVALIRNRSYVDQLSVVIVCPGSMATGKYLEVQIKNYFDFHIIGVYSASEAANVLNGLDERVDFILSTVDLRIDGYQVLKINPFLQMRDLNLIQRYSLRRRKGVVSAHERRRLEFLQQAAQALEDKIITTEIFQSLRRMMDEYELRRLETFRSALAQLLRADWIIFSDVELEWRRAIELAASRLLNDGCITEEYVSQCINNVEEYGDYIIVGPEVALAHANKKYGVKRDGLSLLIAREGVAFDGVYIKVKQ